jgi:hypothetical protein
MKGGGESSQSKGSIMANILEELKQLPRKNGKGQGSKETRAMAIDRDMAIAVRDIAEENRVTLNAVVSYAIQRLVAAIKAAKEAAQ